MAAKLPTNKNKPKVFAIKYPKSMSAQIFKVDSMTKIYSTIIARKAKSPKNLPKTISMIEIGLKIEREAFVVFFPH